MSPIELFASIFAGLGLFFIGIKQLGAHMKELTGRRFRRMLAGVTRNPISTACLGLVAGAVTQSTTAVTFITTSLISSGALPVKRATPLLSWANLGTTLLVLLATFDIQIAVYFLLGMIGLAFYFDLDRSTRLRHVVGSLLAIALLFLGLALIKAGAGPLRESSMVNQVLALISGTPILLILLGAILSLVAQSSTTVAAVAAAMVFSGLLNLPDAVEVVVGANIGSGISVLLLGSGLKGTPRQLSIFQCQFKIFSAFLFLTLLWSLKAAGWIELATLPAATGLSASLLLAFAFMSMQALGALGELPLNGVICRLLDKISPPTKEEAIASFQYLYEHAADDPSTAVELVQLEQARAAGHLPDLLEPHREAPEKELEVAPADLATSCRTLLSTVSGFLDELTERSPSHSIILIINREHTVNSHLMSLIDSLQTFADQAATTHESPVLARPVFLLVEGLHLMLSMLPQALTGDETDWAMLQTISADRASQMEDLRLRILNEQQTISAQEQRALFQLTSLFERLVWLIRQILGQVRSSTHPAAGTSTI